MRKYPLQALHRVRVQKVDECQTELGNKVREVHAAEQVREQRRGELEQCRVQVNEEQAGEMQRAAQGAVLASDLQQLHHYSEAMRLKERELSTRLDVAAERVSAAEASRERTRDELAMSRAEVNLIDKHWEQFRKAESDQQQAAQDEEASEVWGAKQGR